MSEIDRRAVIGGMAAMAAVGVGGTPEKPPGYMPPDQPGVAAGSPNVIRAKKVVIVGANGELLVYNPTVAHGNLAVSIAGVAGTGLASDTVQAGVTAYDSSGDYAQMVSAALNFFIVGMFQAAQLLMGANSTLQASSGLASNVDVGSTLTLQSQSAAGGTSTITLNGGLVNVINNLTVGGNVTVTGTGSSLGGSTSVGAADNGGVTSGPSGTTNSFPAAGPNHTHAMAHHHPYHA